MTDKNDDSPKEVSLPVIIDNETPVDMDLVDYFTLGSDDSSPTILNFSRILSSLICNHNQERVRICTGYFSPAVWRIVGDAFSSLPASDGEPVFRMLIGSEIQKASSEEFQQLFQDFVNDLSSLDLDYNLKEHIVDLIHFLERDDVEVGLQTSPFVHAKLYCFPDAAFVGSSNFTINGLTRNTELNLPTTDPQTIHALRSWFDFHFAHSNKSYKEKLLQALRDCKLGTREWTPYEVFLKIIFEFHRPSLIATKREEAIIDLAEFQREGVQHLIQIIDEFGGAMLADAVGLGKSFQALEVMDRLRRVDPSFRRTLVVCPAQLRENWAKLFDLYGLAAKICSMEALSRDIPRGSFDMIVIDESHNFRNRSINRYRNLMTFLGRNPDIKVLLLTATPINTSLNDLYSQLKIITKGVEAYQPLIDIGIANLRDYFKAVKKEEEDILRLKEHLIVTRSRREIRYRQFVLHQDLFLPDGTPLRFPERELQTVSYSVTPDSSQEFYSKIGEIIYDLLFPQYNLISYRTDLDPDEKEETASVNATAMIKILFLKRLESSIPAFVSSLEIQHRLLSLFLDALANGLILNAQVAREVMKKALEGDVDDLTDEEAISFLNDLIQKYDAGEDDAVQLFKAAKESEGTYDFPQLKRDISHDQSLIEELLALCKGVISPKDHKLAALKETINHYLQSPQTRDKKILIFSYYKDTIKYLYDSLNEELKDRFSIRSSLIFGGVGSKTRTNIVRRFAPKSNTAADLVEGRYREAFIEEPIQPEDEIDILFSTDVLSEGQNLQDAMVLINYDLHWNPVRLIQRIGRIDRLKSLHEKVFIHNFFPEQGLESLLQLVERLENRLQLIDEIIEIDGAVMGETEQTADQRTRQSDLQRIQQADESILDDLEARIELATLEASKKHLLDMINKLTYNHFNKMPLGIHSGMKKGRYSGVMVALREKRPGKRDINLWGFEPDEPKKFEGFPLIDGILTNKRVIERIILCDEKEDRYLPEEANIRGELFRRVVNISRRLQTRLHKKKVLDQFTPKTTPRGNKKFYKYIRLAISKGSIKRKEAQRFLDFLKSQPLKNIMQDVGETIKEFDKAMSKLEKQLKSKNIQEREEAKSQLEPVVSRFLAKIYRYFDRYQIQTPDSNEEKTESLKHEIELVGFLRIYSEE
ncbi:MAG: hypothetical protein GF308_19165 [Candidatus Heimdallarchaeota archaeon]|nr:hypothetical protein [Candidatus Heimdallarchaeota archaeon]